MSKVSDVLLDIEEHLSTDLSDEQIATKVGCPVKWVKDHREQVFFNEHVAPFECENW